jgi:hypothetical protein
MKIIITSITSDQRIYTNFIGEKFTYLILVNIYIRVRDII